MGKKKKKQKDSPICFGDLIPSLENCPFCGAKATIVMNPGINWDGKQEHLNIGAGYGTWYVGCPSPYFEGSCEIHPAACWYARLEDAIKDWNKRISELKKEK